MIQATGKSIIQFVNFIALVIGLYFFLFQLHSNHPVSTFVCEKNTGTGKIEKITCGKIN